MSGQASFALRSRNPDVLTCIANLSNDEVFTPPEFANRMLDTLAEAWAANNKGATSFFVACEDGHVNVVRELLARGAKTEPATGPLPLNMAVGHHSEPMIELLLKYKTNINARDKGGWTPLRMATASAIAIKGQPSRAMMGWG